MGQKVDIIKPKYMSKRYVRSRMTGFIAGFILVALMAPQIIHADSEVENQINPPTLIHNGHLTICKLNREHYEVVQTKKVVVTAYSSSWDETTGIPGIEGLVTASGKRVVDGIVAYNHLPFGTKLRINIPGFEDKIFVVEDRTAEGRRNLDVWMPSKEQAINFGVKVINIEILES